VGHLTRILWVVQERKRERQGKHLIVQEKPSIPEKNRTWNCLKTQKQLDIMKLKL
jgi:hypothetical protein